jgi:hypothetical protein
MKTNMGSTDRAIRVLIAIVLGILIYTNVLTGTLALVLGIVGAILVLTSLMNFCPIYRVFGMSTCKRA